MEEEIKQKISVGLTKTIKKLSKEWETDLKLKEEQILNLLETPPTYDLGDFAFPCFFLAKDFKMSPQDIALKIKEELGSPWTGLEDIQTQGPYVNFFLDRKHLALDLIKNIKTQGNDFGSSEIGKGQKIVIDMSSPNIAKPFGIGHLRSTIIGNSIAKISEFVGYKSIKINYLGDWGTQFGKMIFGYNKFGDGKKLKTNPIKHLLEIYVKSNKETYEENAREEFKKLEQGNKESLKLWEKFKKLSLKKFDEIYSTLGIDFDVVSGESKYNNKMEPIINQLNKKKLLKKSEGAQIVDLKKYNLGVALIQKTDGTSLYATRDLAAAINRKKEYSFNKLFYEAGQEQTLHFKQVFKILELLGYSWASDCKHISHGLYLGKDGKRFATRKGKTIFMEDIFKETQELAKKEIKKRSPKLSKKELNSRAHKVTIASIFYGDLKNYRENNILFDIGRFTSFEGDTGPYLQYSYARASSILKKIKKVPSNVSKLKDLEEKELQLVLKLNEFPEAVQKAYKNLNPAEIANYSYSLAQIFNEFYHECPVIQEKEKQAFRISLVKSFRQVLKNSLNLLGINVLDRM